MSAASSSSGPSGGTWACLSPHESPQQLSPRTPLGRSSTACAILGDTLWLFSGEHTPRVPIDDAVHSFDLRTHAWRRIERADGQPWPRARIGHAGAGFAETNSFYIYGGRLGVSEKDLTLSDLWRWDAKAEAWSEVATTGPHPPPLSYHAAASHGPFLYLFGGCVPENHGRSNGLWRLDTRSGVWEELAAGDGLATHSDARPCARGGPGLAVTATDAWVAFGYNGKEEQSDLFRFDLQKRVWERVAASGDAPSARSVTDLALLDGKSLFVFGGEFTPSAQGHDGAGEYHADSYVLDLASRTWRKVDAGGSATAPYARGWFNTLAWGKQAVVFGGFDGKERRNDVYTFTPQE